MSHFAYVRPSGIWNAGTVVLHAEITQLDQNLFKAINGDNGGTWAPSNIITIGGAGLQVTGIFAATGIAELVGVLTEVGSSPSDVLSVFSTATFSATTTHFVGVTCTGAFVGTTGAFSGSISAANVSTPGALSANGTCSFAGDGAIGTNGSDVWTIEASTVFNGFPVFNGIQNNADLGQHGDLNLFGAGAIVSRLATGVDADHTYSVSTTDIVFIPATLGSTPRIYTVDHVGAVAGKTMRFCLEGGASSSIEIDLQDISGPTRIPPSTTRIKNASTHYTSVDIVFNGSVWKMTAHSPAPF